MDIYTYEDFFNEALALIPLYTKEWTNFNQSDPGITVLENFAAFQVLLQDQVGKVSEEAHRKLLKLLGFKAGENRGSRLFLALQDKDKSLEKPLSFFRHQKLYMGDACLEPVLSSRLQPAALRQVWTECRGVRREVTYLLLDPSVSAGAPVFGEPVVGGREPAAGGREPAAGGREPAFGGREPAFGGKEPAGSGPVAGGVSGGVPVAGSALYLEFSQLPAGGETLSLYMSVEEHEEREPFDEARIPEFAVLQWQLQVESGSGWVDVRAVDETACFLRNGRVLLVMPEHGAGGGTLRCVLLKSRYDLPPVLKAVYDSLVEVEQRDTAAACFLLEGDRVTVESSLVGEDCLEVFCREGPGGGYYRYRHGTGAGRHYTVEDRSETRLTLRFDKALCGYGPCEGQKTVLVVCYTKEMMYHHKIGTVYGYDGQVLELDQLQHVVRDGFSVLVESIDENGENVYRLAEPGNQDEGSLCYELLEEEGALRVVNPGREDGCCLYLAGCAVTMGSRWQARPGSALALDGISLAGLFGQAGTSRETVEELKQRFEESRELPASAVSAADYEHLVRHTPGLCVLLAKAWPSREGRLVEIAVKPAGPGTRPQLSGLYRTVILEHLQDRRLAGAKILLHGPQYVPVYVRGTVYIKSRFGGGESMIRKAVEKEVNELADEAGFGGRVSIDELIRRLLRLPGLDHVYELEIRPSPGTGALVRGGDIVFPNEGIGYFAGESLVFMTKA